MRRPPVFFALLLAALALPAAGCGGESSAGAESEIAFVTSRDGDYAIYGMRADGSGEGRLSSEPESDDVRRTPAQAFFQVEPAWSPDGEQIAFASRRDGRSHIYVMSADGSGTRQLTSGKHDDTAPAWSPDGKWIAFARDGRVFVMTPDGQEAPPRYDARPAARSGSRRGRPTARGSRSCDGSRASRPVRSGGCGPTEAIFSG